MVVGTSLTNGVTVVSSGTETGIVSLSGNCDDENEVLASVDEEIGVVVVSISRLIKYNVLFNYVLLYADKEIFQFFKIYFLVNRR